MKLDLLNRQSEKRGLIFTNKINSNYKTDKELMHQKYSQIQRKDKHKENECQFQKGHEFDKQKKNGTFNSSTQNFFIHKSSYTEKKIPKKIEIEIIIDDLKFFKSDQFVYLFIVKRRLKI